MLIVANNLSRLNYLLRESWRNASARNGVQSIMYSQVDYDEEKYIFVCATLVYKKFLSSFDSNYQFVISHKEIRDNSNISS